MNIVYRITHGLKACTCEKKIGASPVTKYWKSISEEAPKRLHNPRNKNNPKIELRFRGLQFLLIFHVILCTNSTHSHTHTLTHSIHYNHTQHKAPMQLITQHFEPMYWAPYKSPETLFSLVLMSPSLGLKLRIFFCKDFH